jgi:hypothetical protein
MKPSRIFILLLVCAFGFWRQGLTGVVYSIFIFGFLLFVFYTAVDGFHAVARAMRPEPSTAVTINVNQDGAIKGHPDIEGTARHPDPTRPTEEDFAGLITYRLESGRKWHG